MHTDQLVPVGSDERKLGRGSGQRKRHVLQAQLPALDITNRHNVSEEMLMKKVLLNNKLVFI
ncbi:MAG: hypothetical protein DMF04_01580 [Verrucomicrobia bacterium]|nr:MAG: hypothetical protein DMF04_01580 [Verrucomicrobiota bacterium]